MSPMFSRRPSAGKYRYPSATLLPESSLRKNVFPDGAHPIRAFRSMVKSPFLTPLMLFVNQSVRSAFLQSCTQPELVRVKRPSGDVLRLAEGKFANLLWPRISIGANSTTARIPEFFMASDC